MSKEFQKGLDELLMKAEVVPPKTFRITIEEQVSGVFEVEANDLDEAMAIAERNYYSGDFVLEPGSIVCRQMMADDGYETTEWVEF